ncbi:dipeptide ABC transporter ATP-binding protein [Paenibacillus filicis]|uniref:Dipeptide ABC transporter ATP-binding protein n=1 Tax=Paenibacillus filicis TaxID=669464 RepID=A0ABU9DIN0_9BACL
MSEDILQIVDLVKEYPVHGARGKSAVAKAVSKVSFSLRRGETFSLVGESGCGKTTLGRCLVRGIDATSGQVYFCEEDGSRQDFLKVTGKQLKETRKGIQMIFQDPYASLNPRMTVYDIISEPLKANFDLKKSEIDERVMQMAQQTGLNLSYLNRYPHAFSGGQRQRIGIARALITRPKVIVCDEAVSALDVSIQAQIINLLKDLQQEYDITYLFISHDLSVVEHISDRIAVMYLGRIVEMAPTQQLFRTPRHPYTEALLSAVPKPDPDIKTQRKILQGEVPNPADPPSGCHFHPRCAYATELCRQSAPELQDIGGGHAVACHHIEQFQLQGIEDMTHDTQELNYISG